MADRSGVDAHGYHERTKHSPESVRSGHRLDFDNRPTPYKVYEDLPRRSLPDERRPPQQPTLRAIAEAHPNGDPAGHPDLDAVANLCYYAAGVTKRIERRGHTLEFRAAACTGALYHVDLYLVFGDPGGTSGDAGEHPESDAIPPGVYHFDPRTFVLDVLREGDHRDVLARATDYPAIAEAPLSIVTTSTWWRNAWKYRERSFRHAFWDSGTVLANLLAVAHALDLRAEVVTGFADDIVAKLLGVDPTHEAPLEIVPIGAGDPIPDSGPETAEPEPIDPATAPLSPNPQEFPLIHDAWRAGVLDSGAEAATWRSSRPVSPIGTHEPGDGERIPLDPVDRETASARPLHRTIRRRGSCRAFDRESISFQQFSTVLDRAVRGVPMDVRAADDPPLSFVDCYAIVNGVDGIEPGSYHYHPASGDRESTSGELECLRSGEFRREAEHLALDQRLAGDAAACLYFLADLDAITDALGDRGYRVAQLEAALTAGRCYLATYAHRDLGGTGLTFYDDLVTEFFSPRASGQTPMFLYTMGRPQS